MCNFNKSRPSNIPNYEFYFAKHEDAKRVLDAMKNIISFYDVATIADLKDLVGCRGNYSDNAYGWIDSKSMAVRMLDYYDPGRGYLLYMPKPIFLGHGDSVLHTNAPAPGSDCKIEIEFKEALPKSAKDAKIQKAYNVLTREYFRKEGTDEDLVHAVEEALGYLGEVLE